MNFYPELLETICQQVVTDSPTALRAQRITERQAHLAENMILSPDEAELHDLNEVIWSVLESALPLCRSLGVRIILRQDPRLPLVPMLRRPLEDTIASALDMCLNNDAHLIRVETKIYRNRALATIERRCRTNNLSDNLPLTIENALEERSDEYWIDTDLANTAELLIGDRTTRALGGRMRLQHRERDMRLMIELPIRERPHLDWHSGELESAPAPSEKKNHRDFPGTRQVPLTL